MSFLTIQEPDEEIIYYSSDGNEFNEYWLLYSPLQKKRFNKVLKELKNGWLDVHKTLYLMLNHGVDRDEINDLMNKVYKIFLIQYKNKIDYYNEEKLKLRKNNNYIKKKINKMKNLKQKI